MCIVHPRCSHALPTPTPGVPCHAAHLHTIESVTETHGEQVLSFINVDACAQTGSFSRAGVPWVIFPVATISHGGTELHAHPLRHIKPRCFFWRHDAIIRAHHVLSPSQSGHSRFGFQILLKMMFSSLTCSKQSKPRLCQWLRLSVVSLGVGSSATPSRLVCVIAACRKMCSDLDLVLGHASLPCSCHF